MSTRSPLGASHPRTTPRPAIAPLRRLAAVLASLAATLLASMAVGPSRMFGPSAKGFGTGLCGCSMRTVHYAYLRDAVLSRMPWLILIL